MPGVVFDLYRKTGEVLEPSSGNTIELFTFVESETTDIHGDYWFTGLAPGDYEVRENLEKTDTNGNNVPDSDEGLVSTTPETFRTIVKSRQEFVWEAGAWLMQGDANGDGVFNQDDIDYQIDRFALKTQKVVPNSGLKFGNFVLGSVHAIKYDDFNVDGDHDAGEVGMAGINFDLYKKIV